MCVPLVGKRMEENSATLLPTEEFDAWVLGTAGRKAYPSLQKTC